MIIGLTGKNASGKTEAANYLTARGFSYFSLSDEIRLEAKERGIEPTRENLILLGNELRERFGPNILAKRVLSKINGDAVVDSIRNPEEIVELRKNKGFILLGIDAEADKRFDRSVKRARKGDVASLSDFMRLEEKERIGSPAGQQLDVCFSMSDQVIQNNGALNDLHRKIQDIIRPSGK